MGTIQNPGSAIGEAIGKHLEIVLNTYLAQIVAKYDCSLVSQGKENPKTGKASKLLLYDNTQTAFNIDAVVANATRKPLILLEYKYVRYTKHNMDKGSWLCNAHEGIRRKYKSIRSSIAILAGSWSKNAVNMIKSRDITLFIIPFNEISTLLKEYEIQFDWGEKDREAAILAWTKYNALSSSQKILIAEKLIEKIKTELENTIEKILDNNTERELAGISLEIRSKFGERMRFEFPDTETSIKFLTNFNFKESFKIEDAPSID